MSAETVGSRAKTVRKEMAKKQSEMAALLGLALGTWQKIERDEGLPSGETLMAFAKAGINPGWILTGLGPKSKDQDHDPFPANVNVAILAKLGDAVQAVFLQVKQTPPPRAITTEAGKLYNELLGLVKDIGDEQVVEAMIPVLRERFKERIENAEPGAGKRSA